MDCTNHGVSKSRTRPSGFHFHTFFPLPVSVFHSIAFIVLSKIRLTRDFVLVCFLNFYSVLLIYLSFLLLIPYCLDYIVFIGDFEVGRYWSSNVVLQCCVGYSGSFASK